MYLIIMSNGDTHKVTEDVAERVASTHVGGGYTFADPFGDPKVWVNPDQVISIVPFRQKGE